MSYTKAQRKGHRAELEVVHDLRDRGFTTIKSGASKGLFDVVAWTKEKLYFIQVKSGTVATAAEILRLSDAIVPPHGKKYLVIRKPYARALEWRRIE